MLVKPIEAPAVCSRDALLQDFEGELLQQGYPPSTVHRKKRLFADLSDWLQTQELTAGDLSFRLADRFLRDRRSAGFARHKTHRTLRPILDYLHRLKLAPPLEAPVREGPSSVILDRYRRFLTMERSLIATTVERYIDRLRPFLDSRNSADALELGNLRPADIISFVVARCPRENSSTAKLTVTALRSFLGFLHLEGITERSLVCAVPSVARRRLVGLPKGLEPDQVQRLLASCHANTPVGCRDLAILTLLVRLGLRRGEVAKLMLDDIEWRAGTIVVRGKGNCIERIPLPQDVGSQAGRIPETGPPHERTGPGRIRKVRRSLSPSHRDSREHDRGGCCAEGRSRARPRASPAPYRSYATFTYRCLITGNRSTLASRSYRDNSDLCEGRP